jgi:DNA-binding HxlR family transcriptional regulator
MDLTKGKKMQKAIAVTEREMFVFKFLRENDGKPIPAPLPDTIHSLSKKGLVRKGEYLQSMPGIRCYLTSLGKKCVW